MKQLCDDLPPDCMVACHNVGRGMACVLQSHAGHLSACSTAGWACNASKDLLNYILLVVGLARLTM